jgi:hypothetical protein
VLNLVVHKVRGKGGGNCILAEMRVKILSKDKVIDGRDVFMNSGYKWELPYITD